GVLGVLLLSVPPGQARFDWRDLGNRASKLGLSAGFLFAISAVCYRGASLEIEARDPLLRAGTTLAAVTAMQMIGMAIWLRLRQPGEIAAVWRARRVALWVGVMSMAGSFCWFLAFTLQTAAYVKALGQIELVFSALATLLIFRESVSLREWLGIGVLSVSILALVLAI
ncbi:MAG: EamA family transporter, partial [Pseudomonadota bacterium]